MDALPRVPDSNAPSTSRCTGFFFLFVQFFNNFITKKETNLKVFETMLYNEFLVGKTGYSGANVFSAKMEISCVLKIG